MDKIVTISATFKSFYVLLNIDFIIMSDRNCSIIFTPTIERLYCDSLNVECHAS